jgi:tRNA A22 N-methylase
MNRIDSIVNLINDKNATVIDIGCDHALLSIKLLKNKHCNFVYNVDINKKPLLNGIRNIKKNNLSKQTKNIQNDGLKN